MILLIFAVLAGLWAILDFRKKKQVNWVFVALALILLSVEAHFFILKSEIAQYYWASGTAGSGLTYSRCTQDDGYGNCITWTYYTYLDYHDNAVGDYMAYREAEAGAFQILAVPLGFCVLIALIYVIKDILEGAGLLKRLY